MPNRARAAGAVALLTVSLLASARGEAPAQGTPARGVQVFAQFDLPDRWEARFWADPAVKALLALDARALVALVPQQAGVRYCRCPACEASEADNPLAWSVARPDALTCRRCGAIVFGGGEGTDK